MLAHRKSPPDLMMAEYPETAIDLHCWAIVERLSNGEIICWRRFDREEDMLEAVGDLRGGLPLEMMIEKEYPCS